MPNDLGIIVFEMDKNLIIAIITFLSLIVISGLALYFYLRLSEACRYNSDKVKQEAYQRFLEEKRRRRRQRHFEENTRWGNPRPLLH